MFKTLTVVVLLILSCGADDRTGDELQQATTPEYYTCPMHPSVRSEKPGACPVCGMDLVRKSAPAELTGELEAELNVIRLSPSQQVMANVDTRPAQRKKPVKRISAYGKIEHNEKTLTTVSAWIAGRIDTLFVNFSGAYVYKGQSLYSIYSPDLVSTQEEFLLALNSGARFADTLINKQTKLLLESANRRLRLWGLNQKQIDRLKETRKVLTHLRIESPYTGHVIKKMVTEGQYIKEGDALFTMADHSTVWVYSDVYEHEIAFVKPGQSIQLTVPAYPGEIFNGTVSYIDPHFDQTTRTIRVRSVFASAHKLKPGMNASTTIRAVSATAGIVVPATAVLRSGQRDVVWIQTGETTFKPREVKLGHKFGDEYEIVEGLSAGELVAASAGFLIDSESRLQGGFSSEDALEAENGLVSAKIELPSIQCEMCEETIHKALDGLNGLKHVHVNISKKFVSFQYDEKIIGIPAIEKTIAKTGYHANQTPRDEAAYKKLPECCK